ncbi:hypothetical protein EV702DRAFT_977119, partial [Suillus placidus]
MVVPRPHWLNDIKTILESRGLSVRWKVNSGDDRTRRVFFLTDSETHSRALRPLLDCYLMEAEIAVQGAWSLKTPNPRVVFDVVSLDHVQWLHDHPPTIDGRTYYASQYCFVQPLFAFELTIMRCHEFQSAHSTIDNYIQRRYGDVIAHSRMALDGDLYCVVFKHWETADRFLRDSFDAFEGSEGSYGRNFAPVGPYLLYLVNSMGVPRDPSYLGGGPASEAQSVEVKNLCAQMEDIREQGASAMNSFHAILHEFRGVINHLVSQSNQTTSTLGSLAASMIASNNVNHISSHVQSLRMERNSLQMTLLLSASLDDFARQQLTHQLSDLSSQLSATQRQLDNALAHSTALDHTPMPTIASLSPVPVPTLASAISTTPMLQQAAVASSPIVASNLSRSQTLHHPPPSQATQGGTRTSPDRMEGSDMEESDSDEVPFPAFLKPACALIVPIALMECHFSKLIIEHCQKLSPLSLLPARLSRNSLSRITAMFLFALILFVSLLPPARASVPSTLQVFALNSNGLADPMKCNSISRAISDTSPHVWVINETKSSHSTAHRLHLRDYNAFESPGLPNSHSTSSRWGVIVGVRRNISAQYVPVNPSLQGHVVVVDIIISSSSGRGVDMAVVRHFWSQVTDLCSSSPHSWSLYGDCNATTSDCEVTTISPHRLPNRQCFQNFLCEARGIDLWSDRIDRHASELFTCRGTTTGKSIIDRAIHSSYGCFAALPTDSQTPSPWRDLYPKQNEQYRFVDFMNAVDRGIAESNQLETPVLDDPSFSTRFHSLSTVFTAAASTLFEAPRSYSPAKCITSLSIRLLVRESWRLGRLIFAARRSQQQVRHLARVCSWVTPYLDTFACLPQQAPERHSLLHYLLSTRRAIAKLRYREEKDILKSRSLQSSRGKITAVLMGASAKRLYPRSSFVGPPLALLDPLQPGQFLVTPADVKRASTTYFVDLFTRQERSPVPKPWLSTPSVRTINDHVQSDPFVWPRDLNHPITAFRDMAR